ncbi:MAG TPA: FliH/SctL family protein, partial [Burkholderiaceae bacterium]|nr:FliH/SctL family protein [Burkholderiaceae bacterium]
QRHLILRVHPGQVAAVRDKMDELLKAFPAVEYIDVSGDPQLAEDACVIESDIGIVETALSSQIDALRDSFKKVLGTQA